MANVPCTLGVILKDAAGVQVSHELNVAIPEATTLTALMAGVAAYAAVLNPLTDDAGVNAWVRVNAPTTGLRTSPNAGASNVEGGLFTFGKTGMTGKVSLVVPAMQISCLPGGGPNPSEVDTLAWITWIQANATPFSVVDRDQVKLTGFLGSRFTSRNRRKALTRKTTRTS